ncbi:DUF3107 domain-containing protein [Nocardioides pantholopis]|uniref:DUF3107 domain-containing protein n=1 Tax=Nocardioides pantholopis TaxID=2483798 RepID=UPI000F099A2A|nr:DUF3107 domain-containing protein [Nocardioides pantholopis]
MEVKIGVQHAPRELVVETELDGPAVERLLSEAVAAEGVFTLADTKGRSVIIPASKIAYVEVGTGVVGQVGFRS